MARRDSIALSEAAASKPMTGDDVRQSNSKPEVLGYHDHLLEDAIAEKIDHQQARDVSETNRKRNDSRSTQHLFENQFQAFRGNKLKDQRLDGVKMQDKARQKRRESYGP